MPAENNAQKVRRVFDAVAERYDVMNDLMSLGLHRAWKAFAISIARPRPGERVLDIATGSGDLAAARCGSATSTAACSSAAAIACSIRG